MIGMSPEMRAQARQIGEHLGMRIVKYRNQGKLTIELVPRTAGVDVPGLVDTLVHNLATQFYTVFGIGGEIEEAE